MSSFGGFGVPGQGAAVMTAEREIFAQGFESYRSIFKSATIVGTARDAGNTPTTLLRPGLLLGKITATGKYKEWLATGTDGSQDIAGILWKDLRAQDFDANNVDRVFTVVQGLGVMQASQLLVQGVALVGATDEYLARRQLADAGFYLDDDPMGWLAGKGNRISYETGTSDTLTAAQNGMTLFYDNAAAVAVTLPAIKPGLEYVIIRAANEELVVSSPTADNIIVGNDLSADSVTFTTTGEQIGATVRVKSIYVNGTLKWLMYLEPVPFATGLNTMTYAIGT